MDHEVAVIAIVVGALKMILKDLAKRQDEIEIKGFVWFGLVWFWLMAYQPS